MNKIMKSLLILSSIALTFGTLPVLASSTTHSISIDGSGNVKMMSGDFHLNKDYGQFRLETGDSATSVSRDTTLGTWDICYLSYVSIAGEDDSIWDRGLCMLSMYKMTNGLYEMDESNGAEQGFGPSAQPIWYLRAEAQNLVNEVQCSAICMNFTTH